MTNSFKMPTQKEIGNNPSSKERIETAVVTATFSEHLSVT
jgi:hypothetical protein